MNTDFFAKLRANAALMGRPSRTPTIDTSMPPPQPLTLSPPELARGIEIGLDQLRRSSDIGGLLGIDGAQVLLYIRNQGARFDAAVANPSSGPKYHVADCRTLRDMRERNRFGRYVVTDDLSGSFRITEGERDGARGARVRLDVCKNCLLHLNYRDYEAGGQVRAAVFAGFSLPEFFATYSTLFSSLPNGTELVRPGVTRSPGAPVPIGSMTCDACAASLPARSALIASVADGGSKRTLCIDCRRKPPVGEPVYVTEAEMKEIDRARRPNWVGTELSWDDARRYADAAFDGLLRIYERQEQGVPEPGVELQREDGSVCLELGLAWSSSRHAVVLHEHEAALARSLGWDAMTLADALLDSREDG